MEYMFPAPYEKQMSSCRNSTSDTIPPTISPSSRLPPFMVDRLASSFSCGLSLLGLEFLFVSKTFSVKHEWC